MDFLRWQNVGELSSLMVYKVPSFKRSRMKIPRQTYISCALFLLTFLVVPIVAFAQEDEIQVYDAAIADQGKFNLTWHNNFTPVGLKVPAFPGGVITDKTLNG